MRNVQHTGISSLDTATTATGSKIARWVHASAMSSQERCHQNGEDLSEVQTSIARHGNPHRGTTRTAIESKEPDMDGNQCDAVLRTMPPQG